MSARSHRVKILLVVVAVLAVAGVAAYFAARPTVRRVTRPADVRAAKAAGDELLASKDTTVVVFIAHPDDAEWWIGGTLGMLARQNRVVIVLGTSGEAGNAGLQPDLGAIREKLQVEGAAILGYADVVFLRHPDGHLGEAAAYPREVTDIIEREDPAIVITFDTEVEGPVYRHVDHEAAGRTALKAAREHGSIRLYLFHTSRPDVLVDYGPVREAKLKALGVLASYHDTSPLAWLVKLAQITGVEHAAITYGSRSGFPEVGVEYGETFRKDDSAR
jgi:LmbE family N-acetylglucosaminyl deacetylase